MLKERVLCSMRKRDDELSEAGKLGSWEAGRDAGP